MRITGVGGQAFQIDIFFAVVWNSGNYIKRAEEGAIHTVREKDESRQRGVKRRQ